MDILFRFINTGITNPFFDLVLPHLADKDYFVLPGFLAAIIALWFGSRRIRLTIFALALALAVCDFGSEKGIKNVFRAPRPYTAQEGVRVFRGGQWAIYQKEWAGTIDKRSSNGFPSTHAANVAAAAVILAFLTRRSMWATIPLSLIVGTARVYTGNHYPHQVFFGYIWGAACGYAAILAVRWMASRWWPEQPGTPQQVDMPRERKLFYVLLGGWTLMNFVFIRSGVFDLSGDEAQYWDWSRHMALGYYSKPPMVAWLIEALVSAGGNKEWSIRTGAALLTSGAVALIHALTVRIAGDERAGLWAACIAMATPALWALSIFMTVDPLLIFFWALAMLSFHHALEGKRGMWALTGLAMGLGMLSKYTMALLFVSFAVYLTLVEPHWWRRRGPWLTLGISILCMSGVVYWNATNGWVSILHTAAIGASKSFSPGRIFDRFGQFVGGQAGMVSPILFCFILWAIWRCVRVFRQDKNAAFLVCCFGVLFGFYTLTCLTHKPQPNWPGPAYVAGAVAFGWVWTRQERGLAARRWLAAGLALGCLVGLMARSSDLLYMMGSDPAGRPESRLYLLGMTLDPKKDPTNELRGGRELYLALAKYIKKTPDDPFLMSNRYQMTARLAFYAPGKPRAYCIPFERRLNHYDILGGWDELTGRDALFVAGGTLEQAQAWIDGFVKFGAFSSGEYLEPIEIKRGKTLLRMYHICRLHGYTGAMVDPEQVDY